ncbi:MAG: molybdopterin molybdotransferase MoeA [Acidimicrobiia bacterium]|nr:molybdopterin molybdotransferase MoeA [Acidimicrobiia bacterium]
MRGFRQRATVEEALAAALDGVERLEQEPIGIEQCHGRVLAGDVTSTVNVPAFRRATMDGYAVRAEDTFGASAYNPLRLKVIGVSLPGATPNGSVEHGESMRIMTGAPIPDGADAVLRAEDANESEGIVEAHAPVARDRNVGRIGEDIGIGDRVLVDGRRLLPQDVGLLSAIGVNPVSAVRRPLVRVIVSGDELLNPGEQPHGMRIVDSNSPMLAALIERDGGTAEVVRLPDDRDAIRDALALSGADVIVTAGAASVGTEDCVPLLVGELGKLTIHGVTMRPSSPTGVGRIDGAPVLILPGNPVSCMVAYDFFAGPVIRRLGGLPEEWPYPIVRLSLEKRLVSQIGRTDYARVLIENGRVRPLAISGASVLSSVTRASGFVVVPAGLEGYPEGAEVEVSLYGHGGLS